MSCKTVVTCLDIISTAGYVGTNDVFPPNCEVSGSGITSATEKQAAIFTVTTKDKIGNLYTRPVTLNVAIQQVLKGGIFTKGTSRVVDAFIQSSGSGIYSVTYTPTFAGSHTIAVTINDQRINYYNVYLMRY